MKLFKKTKIGKKRIIEIGPFKFSYSRKNKSNDISKICDLSEFNLSKIKILRNYIIDMEDDISQKKYVISQRFIQHGNLYFPNIDEPQSFNEKIQWLNLYYHNPKITECTDKIRFKDYLSRVIGDEFIVPTYGIYDDACQIDFSSLPDEFVLKSNWGGDSMHVLIHDKNSSLSSKDIKYISNCWLLKDNNPYYYAFNWGYKNIKPKLIIEKLLNPSNGSLLDYKFMCFNGEPRVAFVVYNRKTDMSLDFFDMEWNKLDFKRKYKNSEYPADKPKNFEKMKELCRVLSSEFPFVRIDFYECDDKLYIGEFTFTPGGGFEPFTPVEWDYTLGSWIKLPTKCC